MVEAKEGEQTNKRENRRAPLTSTAPVPPTRSRPPHTSRCSRHLDPNTLTRLEARPLPRSVRPQVGVNLPWRATQHQRRDGVPRNLDVAESTEDIDLGVGEDDARSRGVLDDETGLAFVSGETTDRTSQVVAVESLDVLNLEGFLRGEGSQNEWEEVE